MNEGIKEEKSFSGTATPDTESAGGRNVKMLN